MDLRLSAPNGFHGLFKTGVQRDFSADPGSFRVTQRRGEVISQNATVGLSLAMSSTVSMRPIFDLGPRCAEGACSDRVATAAFRQTRACARARRARARKFLFVLIN